MFDANWSQFLVRWVLRFGFVFLLLFWDFFVFVFFWGGLFLFFGFFVCLFVCLRFKALPVLVVRNRTRKFKV